MYSFFATINVSVAAANPFVYTSLVINEGQGFDNSSMAKFTPPHSGFYWLFATIVWDGNTFAEFSLLNTSAPVPRIVRNHTTFSDYDTLSRDFIRQSNTTQVMTSSTLYNTFGNNTIGTAWGGFMLDSIMRPLVSKHRE